MKKGLKTTIILICLLLVIGICIFSVLSSKNKSTGSGGMGQFGGKMGGPQKTMVNSVRTMIAKKTTLTDFILTNGEVETQKSIEIYPSIGGKVVEMNVSLGSHVKKGDVIAYVDPSEPGSYYAKSPINAPIDGSIITSPVKVGQKISASTVVAKIGDIENLQVTAKIPERYVSDVKIGQKAEIILQAYENEVFFANVVRISPVVDPATRTKEIVLNFDKNYSKVNAGMFAKVKLYTIDYSDYPIIPQDSLVDNNDQYFLYAVQEDSTVQKRIVTLGKNVDGFYQILSGIEEGEIVVTEGMLTLYEGATVNDISGNIKVPPKKEKDLE